MVKNDNLIFSTMPYYKSNYISLFLVLCHIIKDDITKGWLKIPKFQLSGAWMLLVNHTRYLFPLGTPHCFPCL